MHKRYPIKAGKSITSMVLVGSIITSNLQQALVEKLIAIPIEVPDPHLDESFYSDYFGLTRVNGIFSATGTSAAEVYYENNSNDNLTE